MHLELGARVDANGASIHGGVSFATGFAGGSPVRSYNAFTLGAGVDADSELGARVSATTAYLHGGPGPLMNRFAFTYLHRANVRLSGSLLYVLRAHDAGGRCWFGDDADCGDRKLSIAAVGLQISGTVDDGTPGAAADVVFDLSH